MASVIGSAAVATSAKAATADPLPLAPLRIPRTDMGVEQQHDSNVQWLQDAKLGMFIHWGGVRGPGQGRVVDAQRSGGTG